MELNIVKERLISNEWHLRSLPSMRSANYYLMHHGGNFYSFDYNAEKDSIGTILKYENVYFDQLLKDTSANYPYTEAYFENSDALHFKLKDIRSIIQLAEDNFSILKKENSLSFRILDNWFVNCNPYFEWHAISADAYECTFNDTRVLGEIFVSLFKNKNTAPETAPEPYRNKQLLIKEKADKYFNHIPVNSQSIIITDKKNENNFGFFKNKNGAFIECNLVLNPAQVSLTDSTDLSNGHKLTDYQMKLYKKIPQSVFQEYIFNKIKSSDNTDTSAIKIDEQIQKQISQFEDFDFVKKGIKEGFLDFQGGEFRLNSLMVYNENELISPVLGKTQDLLKGLKQCFEFKNWYYAVILKAIPLNTIPKIIRNGNELKYIIPLKFSGKISSENIDANLLIEIYKMLSGTNPDTTIKTETIYGDYETTRKASYGDFLFMEEHAIESGHGIHGGIANWRFEHLPAGISLGASSHNDARAGGYISVYINATDDIIDSVKNLMERYLP